MQIADCKLDIVERRRCCHCCRHELAAIGCKLHGSHCNLQVGRMTMAGFEVLGLVDDEDRAVGGSDDELLQEHDGACC
jgi:hypothetical protein